MRLLLSERLLIYNDDFSFYWLRIFIHLLFCIDLINSWIHLVFYGNIVVASIEAFHDYVRNLLDWDLTLRNGLNFRLLSHYMILVE